MEVFRTLSREFEAEYAGALSSYLEVGGESALHRAYELGRKALDGGLTILDVTRFHSELLLNIQTKSDAIDRGKSIADAGAFLSEFLSPFEMTFRGFREVVEDLRNEIAERQNAEEALKQSEKYYKSLIENALDVVTILDGDGTILYTSPSGERVLGYSYSELTGKNVFELIHPDDVDMILEIFSAGRGVPGSTATAEFRYRHRNGEWLIMESIGKNLLDDPFVRGIIVNSRDITDRRNLEEIRRKYEFIANASKEFMLLVNVKGEFEAANEACCTALSLNRGEIIGKKIDEVFSNDSLSEVLKSEIAKCLADAETRSEGWFDLPLTGRTYLEIDCYPYRNILAHVTHAILIMRDATERKVSEDRVRESQRQRAEDLRRYAMLTQQAQEDERRRISRELHDDICQRLTALGLHMNVFEDSVTGQKKLSLRRLRSVKKEINNLINEVRRISHNLRPSALDHFGLTSALRLLCNEYGKINSTEIEFETNVDPNRRYDPNVEIALYRIAQEALSNSIKHGGGTGTHLNIREDGSKLFLIVLDRGKGFNYDDYRIAMATEKHFGLINMRERVELCGGTFKVESAVGLGTTVTAVVPLT